MKFKTIQVTPIIALACITTIGTSLHAQMQTEMNEQAAWPLSFTTVAAQ
jgi:hypothetical protein